MPIQRDDITLTADDHGAGRAAAERPPLPVDPARAARQLAALLRPGPDPGLAALGRDAIRFADRPVLWPLLIGAWKHKEQP